MTNTFDFSQLTDSELTLELINRSGIIFNFDGVITFILDSGVKVAMETKVYESIFVEQN